MNTSRVYVMGGAVVATLVATAVATALTVGLHLPLWGTGIVFAAGLLSFGALARRDRFGVVGAAAFGALGVVLALVLSPTVWLSCVTGATIGWYAALTLMYDRGENASGCRGSSIQRRHSQPGEPSTH